MYIILDLLHWVLHSSLTGLLTAEQAFDLYSVLEGYCQTANAYLVVSFADLGSQTAADLAVVADHEEVDLDVVAARLEVDLAVVAARLEVDLAVVADHWEVGVVLEVDPLVVNHVEVRIVVAVVPH